MMYHESNNLFFGRRKNGDVRILKFPDDYRFAADEWPHPDHGEYPGALFDFTVAEDAWCSAVASVSHAGETADSYWDACELHSAKDFKPIKAGGTS